MDPQLPTHAESRPLSPNTLNDLSALDRNFLSGNREDLGMEQLQFSPATPLIELPAVHDQEIFDLSLGEIVTDGTSHPRDTSLKELPCIWTYRHERNGPLCLQISPTQGLEEEPKHGLRPGSKDPFMGCDFPCRGDDGLEDFAKSSLDVVFHVPEPFGPTPSKETVAEPIYDRKREADQVIFVSEELWRVSVPPQR